MAAKSKTLRAEGFARTLSTSGHRCRLVPSQMQSFRGGGAVAAARDQLGSDSSIPDLARLLHHVNQIPLGCRRAWATLSYDECREVNKNKINRLWREEGLQARVHSTRKRDGISPMPPIVADVPMTLWVDVFQFASAIGGEAIKIASMIDGHAREPLWMW